MPVDLQMVLPESRVAATQPVDPPPAMITSYFSSAIFSPVFVR